MIIYRITNQITGKCYIGLTKQSLRDRWQGHKERAAKGSKTALYDAIRSYGLDAFLVEEVSHLLPTLDFDDLKELEKNIIAQENTMVPNGYNLTAGGDGSIGLTHKRNVGRKASEATKLKMSLLRRGKPVHTEESKKKVGDAHRGKVVSAETRKKLSESQKGKARPRGPMTDEQRAKHKIRMKILWSDPEYRERVGGKISKAQIGRVSPKKGRKLSEEQKAIVVAKYLATRNKNKAA